MLSPDPKIWPSKPNKKVKKIKRIEVFNPVEVDIKTAEFRNNAFSDKRKSNRPFAISPEII